MRSADSSGTLRGLVALAAVTMTGGMVAPWWMRRRMRSRCFTRAVEVPPMQAAIVLGARVHPSGTPSTALEDRLLAALELYDAERVGAIFVTGNARAPEHDEPAAMKQWLCARGVRAEAVWPDPEGLRTIDSMRRAAGSFGIRSAVVCTQRFHLPRALFLADRAGMQAVGLAADRWYRAHARDHGRELFAQARAFVEGYASGPP
jgi:SanA protein